MTERAFTRHGVTDQKIERHMMTAVRTSAPAIPVTGYGCPNGYEPSRLPNVLDNQLSDEDEVVILTRRPPLTPGRLLVPISVRGPQIQHSFTVSVLHA
jgi:hypothetical protein